MLMRLGEWEFTQTSVKPVEGALHPGGKWDFLGYEITYTNSSISQEEADRLMQRYREETGQTGKEKGGVTQEDHK